jgi:hypothetical protein
MRIGHHCLRGEMIELQACEALLSYYAINHPMMTIRVCDNVNGRLSPLHLLSGWNLVLTPTRTRTLKIVVHRQTVELH